MKKITRDETDKKRVQRLWISVKDRLPQVGASVLLSVGTMYSVEGCLHDDGTYCQFRWGAILKAEEVNAWMPLPEPLKEDKT